MEVALFCDMGIAWSDANEFKAENAIVGGGVGLRALIPFMRVIRFDLGYGESGAGVSIHIGGYDKADKQRDRIR